MNTTQNEKVRCLIIGSGPAGYTAAIYASRANLSPVLYEGIQPGGQLTTTTEVENFPGYPEGVTGTELMEDLKQQAARFGADIRIGIATETDLSAAPYKVTIDGEKVIETETLIISTGATAKYLGFKWTRFYPQVGQTVLASIILIVIGQLLKPWLPNGSWINLIWSILVFCLAAIPTSSLILFNRAERKYLLDTISYKLKIKRSKNLTANN